MTINMIGGLSIYCKAERMRNAAASTCSAVLCCSAFPGGGGGSNEAPASQSTSAMHATRATVQQSWNCTFAAQAKRAPRWLPAGGSKTSGGGGVSKRVPEPQFKMNRESLEDIEDIVIIDLIRKLEHVRHPSEQHTTLKGLSHLEKDFVPEAPLHRH